MGRLTTHVLDTANGRPAAGLRLTLHRVDGTRRVPLIEASTNLDGRCDAPLLASENIRRTNDLSSRLPAGSVESETL